MKFVLLVFLSASIISCNNRTVEKKQEGIISDSGIVTEIPTQIKDTAHAQDSVISHAGSQVVMTGNVPADSVVNYAESLMGIPYKYGSIDPEQGFDCSGFITYVFSRFAINVPRSSKDFENVGHSVLLLGAMRGDLILFTGTDTTDRTIGHMGIITSNDHGRVNFIHSTSGKANGVTITPLNEYYLGRYVKTVRVFNK